MAICSQSEAARYPGRGHREDAIMLLMAKSASKGELKRWIKPVTEPADAKYEPADAPYRHVMIKPVTEPAETRYESADAPHRHGACCAPQRRQSRRSLRRRCELSTCSLTRGHCESCTTSRMSVQHVITLPARTMPQSGMGESRTSRTRLAMQPHR